MGEARRSETGPYLRPTTDESPTTFLTLPTSTFLTFSRIQSDRADRIPSPNSYDPQPDRLTRPGAADPELADPEHAALFSTKGAGPIPSRKSNGRRSMWPPLTTASGRPVPKDPTTDAGRVIASLLRRAPSFP